MEVGLLLMCVNICLSLSVTPTSDSTDLKIAVDTLGLVKPNDLKETVTRGDRNVRSPSLGRTFKRHAFKKRNPSFSLFKRTTATTEGIPTSTESIPTSQVGISTSTKSIPTSTKSIPTLTTSRTTTKTSSLRRIFQGRLRAKTFNRRATTLKPTTTTSKPTTTTLKPTTTITTLKPTPSKPIATTLKKTATTLKPTTLSSEEENVSKPLAFGEENVSKPLSTHPKFIQSDSVISDEVISEGRYPKEDILNSQSDYSPVENDRIGLIILEEMKFEDMVDTKSFSKDSLLTIQEHISNSLFSDFEDADSLLPSETHEDSSPHSSLHSPSEISSSVHKILQPSEEPQSSAPPFQRPQQYEIDLKDDITSEEDEINAVISRKPINSRPKTTPPITGTTTKVPRGTSKLFSQRGRSSLLATSSISIVEDKVNAIISQKPINLSPRTTPPTSTTGTTTKVPRGASRLFSQHGRSSILATSSSSIIEDEVNAIISQKPINASPRPTPPSTTAKVPRGLSKLFSQRGRSKLIATSSSTITTTTSTTEGITTTTDEYEESAPGINSLVGIISSEIKEGNPITIRKLSTTKITTSIPDRSNHVPLCPDSVSTYIIPHPQLCDSFFLCEKGQLSTRDCGENLVFSLAEAMCVPPKSGDCFDRPQRNNRYKSLDLASSFPTKTAITSTTTITTTTTTKTSSTLIVCPDSVNNYLIPHPVQCDIFYTCHEGLVSSRVCPDGLVLSLSQLKCVLPSIGDCEDRPQQQPPSGSGPCFRQNGIFFSNDSCTDYVACNNNNPSLESCAEGLVFDTHRKTCTWPDVALRPGCLPSDLLNFRCPNPVLSIEDALASGVQLAFGDHSRHPDLTDCKSFFLCLITGHPRRSDCGPGLVFSHISGLCRPPAEVPGCEDYYGL